MDTINNSVDPVKKNDERNVTIQFRAVCDGRGKALESPIPPKSQW